MAAKLSFWSILFSRLWPVCTPPLATRCRLELASRFNSSLTVNCWSSVAVLPFSPTLSPRPSVLYYRMFDKHLPASVAMSSLLSALNSLFHILLRKCVSTYISYRHIYIHTYHIHIYIWCKKHACLYTLVRSLVGPCLQSLCVCLPDWLLCHGCGDVPWSRGCHFSRFSHHPYGLIASCQVCLWARHSPDSSGWQFQSVFPDQPGYAV